MAPLLQLASCTSCNDLNLDGCTCSASDSTRHQAMEARIVQLEALINEARRGRYIIDTDDVGSPELSEPEREPENRDSGYFSSYSSPVSECTPPLLLERETPPSYGTSFEAFDDGDSITNELVNHLLDVFYTHVFQFHFFMSISEFRGRMALPSTHPDHPHPALVNAMCLNSCHYSPRNLRREEYHLFHRARKHLSTGLISTGFVRGDRPLDFLMAMILTAKYAIAADRFELALVYTSSALSLALGLGLHQLSLTTSSGHTHTPENRLTAHRISLWWSIYAMDRATNWAGNHPAYLSDDDITTPWQLNTRSKTPSTRPSVGSIAQLYDRENCAAHVLPGDSTKTIRMKAMALADRAKAVARRAASTVDQSKLDDVFWESFDATDRALQSFYKSLPSVCSDIVGKGSIIVLDEQHPSNDTVTKNGAVFTLTYAHLATLAGMMHLHGIFEASDRTQHAKMVDAAHAVAHLVRSTVRVDPSNSGIGFASNIASAAQVLLRELQRDHDKQLSVRPLDIRRSDVRPPIPLPQLRFNPSITRLRTDVRTLIQGLIRLQSVYPITRVFQDRIVDQLAGLPTDYV